MQRDNDGHRFASILKATFGMYPGTPAPNKDSMELWWRCLERFTIEQVEHGFASHLNDPKAGQFVPKPADVIRHIQGGHIEDRQAVAERAWVTVMENLNTTDSAVFSDPAIHYAIQIAFGSWVAVGLMEEKQKDWKRKDFVAAYLAYKPGLPYMSRLAGRIECESAKSDVVFNTVRIGDADRCKAVEAGGRGASELWKTKMNALEKVNEKNN